MNEIQKLEKEFVDEVKEVVKEEFLKIAEAKGWKPVEEVKENGKEIKM